MIPILGKVIDSLFSPGRFLFSQQSRGQRSPLLVYVCAIGINLVPALHQSSLLLICCIMQAEFSLPPSTVPARYFCDWCIGPIFSYVSITDFTKLFWSGDAYFGKQDSTYIPLCTSGNYSHHLTFRAAC